MITIKRLVTGVVVSSAIASSVFAGPLEDYLTEHNQVYFTYEEADGFSVHPEYTLSYIGDSDWQFASVSDKSPWSLKGKLIWNADKAIISFTEGENVTSVSYQLALFWSDQFREKWGNLVADQLILAFEQGLITSYELPIRYIIDEVEIESLGQDENLATAITIKQKEQLVIEQHIVDNLQGGWRGTTTPTVVLEPISIGSGDAQIYSKGFTTSSFDARELFTGQWALPVYVPVTFSGQSPEQESRPYVVYDIIDFDNDTPSVEFGLSPEFLHTDSQVQITYDDIKLTYEPLEKISEQLLIRVTVDSPTYNFVFFSNGVKKTPSFERFVRGLASHFPFAQIGYINGRYAHNYYDNNQLDCFGLFGYVFNRDDFSINRGGFCSEGEGDGRENDSIVNPSSENWVWNMNNAKLTMTYTEKSYYTFLERYWDPITFTEDGFGIVLERSKAEEIGTGQRGYLIEPRLNYVKLTDLSQYTQEYANGGFGGDNDGDNIEDGADTDDDNDGMPDYYEESFSLNHLNSADRDEDLDGDGLTNFEEFTLGTYPNDSDSDNDGILDADDSTPLGTNNSTRTPYDYDGDGISDIVIRRPEIGQFIVARSSDNTIMRAFFGSQGTDIPLAGDFDGDGITDVTIRRPSIKQFIALTSSDNQIGRIYFGSQDEDIPVIADYDGDGIDDIAVRRPSTGQWFIQYTTTGEIVREAFGIHSSDIPAVADYDGDGKADIAVRRKDFGQFIIKYSSTGDIGRIGFGSQPSDIPVPADYDGDGKADIAVRRPAEGYWFIKRSTDDVIERVFFGSEASDIPVVADYDGDGKADIAIRRPSTGNWVAKLSSDNSYTRFYFGALSSDIPVAAPLENVLAMTPSEAENPGAGNAPVETFGEFELDTQMQLFKESITPDALWTTKEVSSVD